MIEFNNDVKIGDRFIKGRHVECVVVDIVKTFSMARNEWNEGVIYIAKGVNTMATNSFEVAKATIVRGRIK